MNEWDRSLPLDNGTTVEIPEELRGLSRVDGISLEDGLQYCGNPASFKKFLASFYSHIDAKANELEEAYNKKDYTFYTIKAHALKSSARFIGARQLSAKAEAMEHAGNIMDVLYIDENNQELLDLYRSFKEKLAPFLEGKLTDSVDEAISAHERNAGLRRNPMFNNRVMVVGEKESFLVKALEQKITGAKYECVFAPLDINAISSSWQGTDLVVLFMADGERLDDEVARFLIDKLTDEDKHMMVIGEKNDLAFVEAHIPHDIIYKTFLRPVDNEEFVKALSELFDKVRQGEFKKSILVVDDDASYLGLIREWLKDKYKVNMVSSGLQAIKWLGKNNADLILLDHEMPVTSGPQVLEMLRSDEETRKIPVIFLTGKSDKESVMSVVALKPEGYFLKTIERQELLDKLEEFFILHQ